ncbi:MAG TPA: hypothetical protein VKN14_05705, partial [Flavobacteriaceae bacterium]|nr:hypothetical protein [Flavobacteriaceae bacterium]
DFISLKKLQFHDNIETGVTIIGDMNGKKIAPFLLLPFIDYSFKRCCDHGEKAWINMDINMENDQFSMKLSNGMKYSEENVPALTKEVFNNVQKRLSLLYPQKHELKISRESEMLIVILKINTTLELEIIGSST